MKAIASTIHAEHLDRSAAHAVPRGVGVWGKAEDSIALLVLGWIVGWALVLSLAVIALATVSTSVGPQAAAVPEVRRPSDSGMASGPSVFFETESDVYDVP